MSDDRIHYNLLSKRCGNFKISAHGRVHHNSDHDLIHDGRKIIHVEFSGGKGDDRPSLLL